MYYVLYRVLSYWYLLCSRKANFYVIPSQSNLCILYSVLSVWWVTAVVLMVICLMGHGSSADGYLFNGSRQ